MSETISVLFLIFSITCIFWVQSEKGVVHNEVAVDERNLEISDFLRLFDGAQTASEPELATLTIKTRNFMSGATGSIHFILYDVNGNKSKEIELPRDFWKKVLATYVVGTFMFKENSSVPFNISEANDLAEIQSIEVWHTPPKYTYSKEWKPELITIEQNTTGDVGYFPIDRWLTEQIHYFYEKYDAVLPQNDQHKRQRAVEINKNRKLYQYTAFVDGAVPMVKKMAKDEPFTSNYTLKALANAAEALTARLLIAKQIPENWDNFTHFNAAYIGPYTRPMYFDVDFRSDVWFGRQRLQGINPSVISLINSIPDNLNVTDVNVGNLLGNYSLSTALEHNRIFICDLSIMKDFKQKFELQAVTYRHSTCTMSIQCTAGKFGCTLQPNDQKIQVIPAPTALFFLNETDILLPIAIQLMPDKGPDNPVFTPEDEPNTWQLAKFYYNLGEASHHETIVHFAMTHVVLEGIIICTYRQLSLSHPVFRLLKPHFLFTLPINHLALAGLINPGGLVEKASNMNSEGWLHFVGLSIATMNWTEYGNQHVNFAKRRVEKHNLEDYPYRDDVLRVYNLTRRYVKRVLKVYYKNREDLLDDEEIQNWRIEMSRSSRRMRGLNLKGVPGDDNVGFTKLSQLIDTITIIIHTASARHATVNFLQYEWYGYPPNYPLYLKGPIPTRKESLTDKELLDYLTKRDRFLDCLTLMHMLSIRTTNELGNFEVPVLYHPDAVNAVTRFQNDIKKASRVIRRRNKKRKIPYIWADPQLIPNAISI